jgi:hypothetical protein
MKRLSLSFKSSGGREGFLDDTDARPLTLGGFATAFYSGLWAYDGWNNLVIIGNDISKTFIQRHLPIFL